MDEQDKKLVSRARDIAFLKSYEGWADIYELKKEARSPEARKVIHGILTELNHTGGSLRGRVMTDKETGDESESPGRPFEEGGPQLQAPRRERRVRPPRHEGGQRLARGPQ